MRKRCRSHFDCDGLHCHPRYVGAEAKLRVDDVCFAFRYDKAHFKGAYAFAGTLYLSLTVSAEIGFFDTFELEGFKLSFCVACGKFIGFGVKDSVCWLCQEEEEELDEL